MKDSQHIAVLGLGVFKYIKANNERFSTALFTSDSAL